MVYEALTEQELKSFYKNLWASEAKHGNIFVKMTFNYFPKNKVYDRLNEFNELEAKVLDLLPLSAALH